MEDLGINPANLIIQLIAFVAFVAIFWKLALGPITNMLDERRRRIQEGMEAAERMQRELEATRAQNEEVLNQARREAQQILAQARENSEQMLARAQEQARAEAEQMIEKARATIQAEQQQAWQQLRQDVADLAIAAATKIVRRELDRADQARLRQETLAEAGNGRARA